MILRASIFKDNVRMPMCLSKQKSLYDISVFSEACTSENYKLVVSLLSRAYLQLCFYEVQFFFNSFYIVYYAIVVAGHVPKFLQFLKKC